MGEPQRPPRSIFRNRNGSNSQTVHPFPFHNSNGPPRNPSGKSSSGYAPPYQQQLSQGTSFSQSLPSFQQLGVNEGAANDPVINICAVHRHATTSSRLATSTVNTALPSSSKHRLQDLPSSPSLSGRQPTTGDSSSTAGTSHLTITPNRFHDRSQSSEGSSYHQAMDCDDDDAGLYNDPPPPFDDALLAAAPVGGSRSEGSSFSSLTYHR